MAMPLAARRFTLDEYHRMGRAGVFDEDERVELLDGRIVEMTPIGPEHAGCVGALNRLLNRLVGDRAVVWVQNPVDLSQWAELQPDIAVLAPRSHGYRTAHPGTDDILLVIEVAVSSLEHDRDVKLPLYAAAEVPEVWLVNLPGDTIAVYRDPGPGGYATVRIARRGDSLDALRLPGVALLVSDILG